MTASTTASTTRAPTTAHPTSAPRPTDPPPARQEDPVTDPTPQPGPAVPTPPPGVPLYGTPPPPASGPPVYGTPPPAAYAPYAGPPVHLRRTNGLAIAALVTGLFGFALIPVVLGHLGLRQTRRTGDAGAWMAVVGLVLGYVACALYLLVFAVFGGFVLWGVQQ